MTTEPTPAERLAALAKRCHEGNLSLARAKAVLDTGVLVQLQLLTTQKNYETHQTRKKQINQN
jgi:hypothetical protein